MPMFYFDDNIDKLEKNQEFREILNYLENNVPFLDENFATQIAYAWHLYSEGLFINQEVENDWKYYQDKWVRNLFYAKQNCRALPKTCLMVAYTLELNGMDISSDLTYEEDYKNFYNLSLLNFHDKNLTQLIKFLKSGRTKLSLKIINELFPKKSILDKYFIEILMNRRK